MYALLLADDPDEGALLSLALQRSGLAVSTAQNLEKTLASWSDRPLDVIVLALTNPTLQQQIRLVRNDMQTPCILISNPVDEPTYCSLLEHGADMVFTRPYSMRVLIAQMRALLRRGNGLSLFGLPTLNVSGLILDPATRSVKIQDHDTKRLTHLEFRLLYTLMINRGQTLATENIVEQVWGYNGRGDRDLVRGLISRLRNKIEANPRHPYYILTISGIGYTFINDKSL